MALKPSPIKVINLVPFHPFIPHQIPTIVQKDMQHPSATSPSLRLRVLDLITPDYWDLPRIQG
jgi:hypothetical protein